MDNEFCVKLVSLPELHGDEGYKTCNLFPVHSYLYCIRTTIKNQNSCIEERVGWKLTALCSKVYSQWVLVNAQFSFKSGRGGMLQ